VNYSNTLIRVGNYPDYWQGARHLISFDDISVNIDEDSEALDIEEYEPRFLCSVDLICQNKDRVSDLAYSSAFACRKYILE